jgi:hypothetical protein
MSRDTNRRHRPDHWVYLDRWWAKRLGVKRTAGMYRIRSRDLVRRTALENLGVDASGTICVRGNRAERRNDQDRVTATADNLCENVYAPRST